MGVQLSVISYQLNVRRFPTAIVKISVHFTAITKFCRSQISDINYKICLSQLTVKVLTNSQVSRPLVNLSLFVKLES